MENMKLTILVVEDSLLYQQLIARLLKPLDAQVLFFSSGEEVMQQLPFEKADLAILDYNLDGTMTGLDTLKAVRIHHPSTYVIVFSTRFELNTSDNVRLYGDFYFIEKNNEGLHHLQEKVSEVICAMQI